MLYPTPRRRLVDERGRPYFLWDEEETTLEGFLARLHDPDPAVRAYSLAKLMRQAKPDDVFTFATRSQIEALWSRLVIHVGSQRPFWTWILERWRESERGSG